MSAGTPRRTIRIEDGLWDRAQKAAAEQGVSVSEVIRVALVMYTQTPEEIERIFIDA